MEYQAFRYHVFLVCDARFVFHHLLDVFLIICLMIDYISFPGNLFSGNKDDFVNIVLLSTVSPGTLADFEVKISTKASL